jgi:hypothetical protein
MDVVVTVPKGQWLDWLAEGDLPGEESQSLSHFWVSTLPSIKAGERVYIVSHSRLRGFAPLVGWEQSCTLRRDRMCLLRRGDAEAVTIPGDVRGFQGWRYRWWEPQDERPFPDWMTDGVLM